MPAPSVSHGRLAGREDGGLSVQVPLPGQDVSPEPQARGHRRQWSRKTSPSHFNSGF